jgi:predicted SAM-dependent methyltransferase
MVTRSHAIFVNKDRIRDLKLLNIGCGPNIYPQFINLDYSWQPGINICWDITKKPYPLSNDSLDGIFTEHCLEHISVPACQKNLEEFHRLLKPGGTLRIVVPDAEIYYTIYNKRLNGEKIAMPYEESYISPNARINGLFRNHGHQFIYDFETFRIMLQKAGFKDIKKEKYREGRNPALLVDTDWRAVESLYVEASK